MNPDLRLDEIDVDSFAPSLLSLGIFLGPSRPSRLYIRHSLPNSGSHSWAEFHAGSDG